MSRLWEACVGARVRGGLSPGGAPSGSGPAEAAGHDDVGMRRKSPDDCGVGCGSAESRSCRGSDGRREAPGRAGLRESAQAVATARRRTPRSGLLPEKNETLDHLISLSGAVQLRHLSNNLEILLKRDFLKLLPLELSFYLLKWLDPQTLLTCCLVSKQWNKVISACTEVWQTACKNLGWQIDDSVQDPLHWKKVYLKAILRMKQLKDHEAFETSSLIGHSARVYALYYKDGLLCTGSDDLSAKLWDVSTGQCIYGIQTHTCAAVKFDEQKLVTGSFDNTVACWEWSSGAKTQHFRGHTGAVFSVDYNDELDILVSGSADFTVKVWALSTGTCLNTLTGHTEWVTKVVLQKCKVKSLMHSPGDYILLSADKYEIKIWPIGREINCKCLRTLSVSEDRSISLQPRLHFDGKYIVCSSALGLYQWDFASYDILRVIKPPDFSNVSLLGFGEIFALLFDNRYLYIMDLRTEKLISRWPLPEYRKSKRGSSFLAGEMSWLNGLNGQNDTGLVFATSMPDHSIHLVLWKEHG
ncbi:F-box/WD repeat-containing protein 2 isoform X2 [Onychostruthus taczanowskii]|uniref:F-box/WD repeat-containing protein 2 isoform X2 n=1 Tax=Onychostruthus taczanowskii TaxID=356909 RepID=UPI001B80386E|nr:F-box/WD repeat-containing protein 2 isoform X2 [Onychostruthus taczanowskii]